MPDDAIVLGFTGSFGSGCSTFADRIAKAYGFEQTRLSQRLWDEAGENATRETLQAAGDKIRENEGNDALARWAVGQWEKQGEPKRFIFDSIKNPDEITYLRSRFRHFYLVAVGAPSEDRWPRVKDTYKKWGLLRGHFDADDDRDREEADIPHGQNVRGCIEKSDLILDNSDADSLDNNVNRLVEYMNIVLGVVQFKSPSWNELHMNHAFLVARMSHCCQRQVGAVIADQNNYLVASGFNDVPKGIRPCREYAPSKGKCFRHYMRTCPECGFKVDPPGICPNCKADITDVSRSRKDLDLCRAAHAEENAILQIARRGGTSLFGCTLYTTTFPCLLCAKKVINAGISRVVYVDPYPVRESWDMLQEANVELLRYSGTTPVGYVKLYGELDGRENGNG